MEKRTLLQTIGAFIILVPLLHIYYAYFTGSLLNQPQQYVPPPNMEISHPSPPPSHQTEDYEVDFTSEIAQGGGGHEFKAFKEKWWNSDQQNKLNDYPGPRRDDAIQFWKDWTKQPPLSEKQLNNPNLDADMKCLFENDSKDHCWNTILHKNWVQAINYIAKYPDATIERVWPKAGESDMFQDGGQHVHGHGLFDLIIPTYACDYNNFQRVGRGGDGGKWLCHLPTFDNCVIYSLGSNGDFSFEEDIYNKTQGKCKVYTFDCTISEDVVPEYDWLKFEQWCLGEDGTDEHGRVFKSLASITKHFKHERIHLLKMDIEGAEWPVFDSILDPSLKEKLPAQISFEWHVGGLGKLCCDNDQQKRSIFFRFLEMVKRWDDLGYRVVAKERNYFGDCCTEFTLLKTRKTANGDEFHW